MNTCGSTAWYSTPRVLKLLRSKADAGCAVIMSLHDAGLAARFADQALLLFGNGQWLHGSVDEIITAETLSQLYATPMLMLDSTQGRYFVSA